MLNFIHGQEAVTMTEGEASALAEVSASLTAAQRQLDQVLGGLDAGRPAA